MLFKFKNCNKLFHFCFFVRKWAICAALPILFKYQYWIFTPPTRSFFDYLKDILVPPWIYTAWLTFSLSFIFLIISISFTTDSKESVTSPLSELKKHIFSSFRILQHETTHLSTLSSHEYEISPVSIVSVIDFFIALPCRRTVVLLLWCLILQTQGVQIWMGDQFWKLCICIFFLFRKMLPH